MKKCKKCGLFKQENKFYKFNYHGKKRFGNNCKICNNLIDCKRQKLRQVRIKKELFEKLGGKCGKCGNQDLRVIDFHHLNKERKNKNVYNASSLKRMKSYRKEIKNLEPLCANCHRIHNFETIWTNKYKIMY